MTEQLKLKLNDSKATRWGALVIVAFTMMAAYYVNDVVAPLKTMLETDLAWSSTDFGFFTGGYSFLNVFFLMLIWGGLILRPLWHPLHRKAGNYLDGRWYST